MKKHVNLKEVKFSFDKLSNLSGKETESINGGGLDVFVRPLYGIKFPPVMPLYGIFPKDEILVYNS